MKKGISLIVLVITIIVMIILAGSIMISLGNSGIIDQASKAVFVSNIKTFLEDYGVYQAFYVMEGNKLSELNVSSDNIHTVIESMPEDWAYRNKLEVISGVLTYMVNVKDKGDVERATWVCEAGMKVNGVTSCSDIEYIEIHQTAFEKQGTIYYNTPDITGFNPETTYFVTYDSAGNEVIGNNIGKKAPDNWFDYQNKKWANIVTINDNLKAYFVWIPRYAYKVDSTNKVVDVRFVDNTNVYVAADGSKITYNDTTPTYDENGDQTNYIVNSAFNINMGTEEIPEIKALAGFWISKYEVSDTIVVSPEIDSLDTEIIVYRCNSAIPSGYMYEFYIDDDFKGTNTTGTFTYEGLTPNTVYNIKILVKSGDIETGRAEKTIKTSGTPIYNTANSPELGELLKAGTYYLTWDDDGNETRTEVVDSSGNAVTAPSDWYDYNSKKWANIVVVNETLGSETYLVWIPRYEYRMLSASSTASEKKVDIAFIPTTKLEATSGYTIHPSFDINIGTEADPEIKHLAGFWMSKYEVQDVE